MNRQTLMRGWHSLRLMMISSSGKRASYLRKHKVFKHIGNNCTIVERKVPLYPRLISLGNNVHLAAKVLLVTHDAIHLCLNNINYNSVEPTIFKEKIGCIEIGNNVFIGANSVVLSDVTIGSNVIIGAGSIVNNNIPDNSIAVGVPAKVIGSFDSFVDKRRKMNMYPDELVPCGHNISRDLEKWCWDNHHKTIR